MPVNRVNAAMLAAAVHSCAMRRRCGTVRRCTALALLLIAGAGHAGEPPADDGGLQDPSRHRPADLVVLQDRPVPYGREVIGAYAVTPVAGQPTMRQLKLWIEQVNNVSVRRETVNCDPAAPSRLTREGSQLQLIELNPGGAVGPHNRLSHQIWWAACHPSQAGRDPAGLAIVARRLGYDGQRREGLQILPAGPIPPR